MKPVPPTLREKKRYIPFRVFAEGQVTKRQVIDAILEETLRFFGESRTSDFGLWVVEFDEKSKEGFLVCNHRHKSEVIACLTLINSLAQQKASFHVLGISGTIKSMKRKFLKDDTDMSHE